MRTTRALWALALAVAMMAVPTHVAAAAETQAIEPVDVSADGDAARIEGCDFAVSGFQRIQAGSNRDVNGEYHGYTYLLNGGEAVVLGTAERVVVYVPAQIAGRYGIDVAGGQALDDLQRFIQVVDAGAANGGTKLEEIGEWLFTTDLAFQVDGVSYLFDQELMEGRFYTCIIGADGGDVRDQVRPVCADTFQIVASHEAVIVEEGTSLEQLGGFLSTVDLSPLWVTLKTTGTAIVFIFVLGLAAAYFTLRMPKRAQDIFDTIFTIPMVLPPTVCGFILLWLLGKNTPVGQWFVDIGFPLFFSWPATVIAATVVAFPLMYRSSRGAFENLDQNMLDAARTLGWSNARIFFRLMIPLSWSSIAAATVLAFARALGEFGATLFLAGNQIGVTRTIPIAIYFEWMGGDQAAAWFWTVVLLVFSFAVILAINLIGRHTTRYRDRGRSSEDEAGGSDGHALGLDEAAYDLVAESELGELAEGGAR